VLSRVIPATVITHKFAPCHDAIAVNLMRSEVSVTGSLNRKGKGAIYDFPISQKLGIGNARCMDAGGSPSIRAILSLEKSIIDISHTILAEPSLELSVEGGKGLNVTVPFNALIDPLADYDGRIGDGFPTRRVL
jgi:hypothetical protein